MQKLIYLLACLLFIVQARVFNRKITIAEIRRNQGWIFLDRMAFDQGTISIIFQAKLQSQTEPKNDPLPVELAVIPDQLWNQQSTFKCDIKKQSGGSLGLTTQLRKSEGYAGTILHEIILNRPTTYHFVLRDCQRMVSNDYFRRQTKLAINLQMKNGGYEHGSDENINKYMLPFLLFLTIAMAYFNKGPKHNEAAGQERDWAKFTLFITLIINFCALVFNYLGFLIYLSGGTFYGFFDFTYLFFHSLSETMLTSLIIFIAYGWTITFVKDAEFDLYVPLVAMLGIINLILTLLGKINDGDSDKYHMYDTIPSYLLIFFRFITLIVFIVGIIKLYLENSKNSQIVKFLANFGFLGAIYFLSLPAIMLLVSLLPPSSRKQIVFFSVQLIKNGINLILTYMISSKSSKYRSVKHSGQSFFQSGNKIL